jgi:hypothetical protein
MFFTANPIGNRWLELMFDGPPPAFDRGLVHRALTGNVRTLIDPPDPATTGLPGLRTFLDRSWQRLPADPAVVDEVFVVAGPVLAVTGLHASFLATAGRQFADPGALELSRMVEAVAHHWSALRIGVATARDEPAAAVPRLRRRGERLLAEYDRVIEAAGRYLSGLSPTAGGNPISTAFTQ